MKFLITGIAGFVGSSLARAILKKIPNADITGIDNYSFGYRDRILDILDYIEFIEGDLESIQLLLGNRQFDTIVHCAAIAPLPECQRDSYRAITQNVAVCGSIVDYALTTGTRDILFFSSGAIYESTNQFPTQENTTVETSLVYPTTKYIAEQYFEAMCRSHQLNVTAIRLFNLYGPMQDYFRKQPPLIGYLLKSLLKNEEAILYSTGTQRRDYIYIDDLLNLVLESAMKMKLSSTGGNFIAVNAGSGESISVNEIIEELEAVSGMKLKIRRKPSCQYWDKYPEIFERAIPINEQVIKREVEKRTLASLNKVKDEFNWSAEIKMSYGLKSCFEYAQKIIK